MAVFGAQRLDLRLSFVAARSQNVHDLQHQNLQLLEPLDCLWSLRTLVRIDKIVVHLPSLSSLLMFPRGSVFLWGHLYNNCHLNED